MSKSIRPERRVTADVVLLALSLAAAPAFADEVPAPAAATPSPATGAVGPDLRLLRVTPEGDDVEAGRQIVLAFDRPVVPLGRMERKPEEVPVTIAPAVACEWRWLDPRTLACQLPEDAPLREATAYTVVVGVAVRAEFVTGKGEHLSAASTHSFTTQRPTLRYSSVSTWEAPGVPVLRLYFDQPVTQASLAASLRFGATAATILPERLDSSTPFYAPAAGEEPAGEARRTWLVKPATPLPANRDGSLQIRPGLRSALGEARGIENRVALKLHTFPDFAFLGLRCIAAEGGVELRIADNRAAQKRQCDPLRGAALLFSAPVALDELRPSLKIAPDPAGGRKDYDPWADAPEHLNLARNNLDSREYEVRLPFTLKSDVDYVFEGDTGVKDIFGRALASAWSLSLHTAHRSSALNFEHTTAVLEKGVDSEVPVVVTNLKQLHADFTRVTAAGVTHDQAARPVAAVSDLAFAMPLGVREMLGGGSGVVDGHLTTTPPLATPADGREDKTPGEHFFAEVTPWQVHVKLGHYNSLVWITEFATGKPVAGAQVSLYAAQKANWQPLGEVPPAVSTGADGLAELPGAADVDPQLAHSGWRPKAPLAVRVVKDKDFALVPLDDDFNVDVYRASRYQVSAWQKPRYGHLRSWGTTAQGVYRAGDTIQYKVYVRSEANRGLAPAPAGPYKLRVFDPADAPVYERSDIQLSAFGAFDGEFTVPKQGKVGWYRFQLTPLFAKQKKSPNEADENESELAPLRVLVSDFTPAPFHLATELRAVRVQAGTAVIAELRASLHAGGPFAAAPARLAARLVAQPLEPDDPLASKFQFSSFEDEARDQRALAEPHGQTDAQGGFSASIDIPDASAGNDIAWGRLEVEGSAADDRGRAIAATASIPYAGRDRYIGVQQKDWLLHEGKASEVQTLVIDDAGKPVAGSPTYVRIERREVTMARVKDIGNVYVARYSERWQPLTVCKSRSQLTPVACRFTPDVGGGYRVTAMTRDTRNRLHTSRLSLWASGKNTFLWEEPDDYGVELVPDRKSYRVGETARFLVKNPYPGASALVTTERYGVIGHRVQLLEGSAPVVEVPITPELLPGFYLSVVVQSPRVAAPPPAEKDAVSGEVDLGKPAFRMGYAKVTVEDPYRMIDVKIAPEHHEYKPRDTARVELTATPRHPATGTEDGRIELAVAVLDEAVFDLIQGRDAYFDPARGLSALDPLDLANYSLLTRLVGRQKFEKKGATPGGDGGVDLSLRSVDKFVAYWNPALATDAQGRASFEFKLPDNLTAWRVIALASTPGDRFGLGHVSIKSSRDTELRSLLPNQVHAGDRFEAGFSVQNRAASPRTVDVDLSAAGAAQARHHESVALAAFERKTVAFEVATEGAGEILFTARAGDARDRDALTQKLVIAPRQPNVTVADYGTLDGGELKLPIAVPPDILPGGDISVTFSTSVLGNLDGTFAYVRDYPYECWEQRLARGLMAAQYGQLKPWLDPQFVWADAAELTAKMFSDAAAFQATSGGMSYWDADEGHVSPYLSAYTALAFEWLRAAGASPPKTVSDKLDHYLDRVLRKQVPDYSPEASSAVRAVILDALALRGTLDKAELERFAPSLPRMGLFGQSLFLHAALKTPQAETLAADALKTVLAHGQESAGSLVLKEVDDDFWAALLGTPLRSNCAALSALVEAEGDAAGDRAGLLELTAKLARSIGQARGGARRDHWSNTQETLFCLNALADYAKQHEAEAPSLKLRASLDSAPLGEAHFEDRRAAPVRLAHPLVAEDLGQRRELELSHEGQGRAYFAARLSYVEKDENAKAANAGLELHRSYSVKRDGHWQPLTGSPMRIHRGELVRVELRVSTPAARTQVVVDDPLPGGLEPVNSDLATASGFSAADAEPPDGAYPYPFYHRELRFDAARFFADVLAAGEYKLYWIGQAVAVGEFAVPAPHAEAMYDPDVFGNDVPARLLVDADLRPHPP